MAIGYDTLETVHSTDTFEEWRKKTNAIITFNDSVRTNIGDLNLLSTEDKFSLVNAINEVDNNADTNTQSIGNLTLLESDISAVDLVTAINNNYSWQKTNTDSQIDKEIVDRTAADLAIQSELDASQVSMGINDNGTFSVLSNATYVNGSTNMRSAVGTLDTSLKSTSDLLDVLIDSVGAESNATLNLPNSVNYIVPGKDIKDNMIILDSSVKSVAEAVATLPAPIAANAAKINNIIATLGSDATGTRIAYNPELITATASNISSNIKLLDNKIVLLDAKDTSIDAAIASLTDSVGGTGAMIDSVIIPINAKLTNIITTIGSDATGTRIAYNPELITATASDLSTNIKLLDNKIELLDAKDTAIDAAIASLTDSVGGTGAFIAIEIMPIKQEIANIIATLGTISNVGAMTDADITVNAVKNTFANTTNIRSNINLLDAELDAVNTRANNISISSVAGLQAALGATANASIIGNLDDLAAGFPNKESATTIVDALNSLYAHVSAVITDYNNHEGFVRRAHPGGDVMITGLKIIDSHLLVGNVAGVRSSDFTNQIACTDDITAFHK